MPCIFIHEMEKPAVGVYRQEFEIITKVYVIEQDYEFSVSFYNGDSYYLIGKLKERERALALVRYLLTKNEVVSVPLDPAKLDKFIEEENKQWKNF